MAATDPVDLIALAISRLPHMYRGDAAHETNQQKMLRALLSPAPALAQAMIDVIIQGTIDDAQGVQLDEIGALVGRARQGVTDDEIYRRYIRAQVAANKSDGVIDDILNVAGLVIGDAPGVVVLRNEGIAAFVLNAISTGIGDAVAQVLIELVIKATDAGVRAIVEYAPETPVFRFDTGPGYDVGHYATALDHV